MDSSCLLLGLLAFFQCSYASLTAEQLSREVEALVVRSNFAAADKLLTGVEQQQEPVALNDLGLIRFLLNGDTKQEQPDPRCRATV